MKLRGLDLFSGIGGISLALKPWVQTIAYCECEPYAQAVLLERMASGDLDSAPIWDDVRTLNRAVFDAEIDIISGGFPCQDVSIAGHGKGLEGERSGLFFEIARLTSEYRPRFIFLENVPAICTRGGVEVVETLTSLGYECRWGVLSAFDVGAPHLRERWWCLAHAHGVGLAKPEARYGTIREEITEPSARLFSENWRDPWSSVLRNDARVSSRVDRIKALGNSVVPKAAREAFMRLAGLK